MSLPSWAALTCTWSIKSAAKDISAQSFSGGSLQDHNWIGHWIWLHNKYLSCVVGAICPILVRKIPTGHMRMVGRQSARGGHYRQVLLCKIYGHILFVSWSDCLQLAVSIWIPLLCSVYCKNGILNVTTYWLATGATTFWGSEVNATLK